jgi:hypothetical protein
VMNPMLSCDVSCGSVGDPSQMPCHDGPDSIIRSGDDIPINRVKHRGDCFGNKAIEDYDSKRI